MQRVLAEEDLTGMEVLVENCWSLSSIMPLWCTVIETLTLKLPRVCHLPCLHRDTWYVFHTHSPVPPRFFVGSTLTPSFSQLHMSGLLVPGAHNSNHRNPYDSGCFNRKNLKKPYVQRAVLFEAGAGKPPFFLRGDSYRICTSTSGKFSTVMLGDGFTCASCHTICYPKEVYFGSWNTEDWAAQKHGRSKQNIECCIFMLPFHRSSKYCPVRIVQNTLRASLKKKSKEHEKRKCTCIDTETLVPTPSNFVEAEVKS